MEALEPCQQIDRVSDLMTPRPVTVTPDATLGEVYEIMEERRIRHVPVVGEAGEILGIVSQRDLVGFAGAGAHPSAIDWGGATVGSVMHEGPDTVSPECCAAEAARHMLRTKRSSLPVVDEKGLVVGIVTEADFVRLAMRGAPPCTCGGVDVAG